MRFRRKLNNFAPLELFYIVAVASATRVVALFLLPNYPFVPDEGTYANLSAWVAAGDPVIEFPAYGAALYDSAKTFILPSAFLIRFGFDPLYATRTISLTYGVLSVYLFGKLLLVATEKIHGVTEVQKKKFFAIIVSVFAFLPSTFLWSILGLKESASMFWIIMSSYLLFSLINPSHKLSTKSKFVLSLYGTVIIPLSISLAFGVRRETSLVFLVFFCTPLIVLAKNKRFTIGLAFVLSLIGGHLLTQTPDTEIKEVKGTQIHVVVPSEGIFTVSTVRSALSQSVVRKVADLETQRNVNTIDANTALPLTECAERSRSTFARLMCNINELPFRLLSTLFRPLILFDEEISFQITLASLENLFWISIFTIFTFASASLLKHKTSLALVLPTLIYVLSFACLMALYQGNLGTAFRHKSTMLWPILFVVFLYAVTKRSRGNYDGAEK